MTAQTQYIIFCKAYAVTSSEHEHHLEHDARARERSHRERSLQGSLGTGTELQDHTTADLLCLVLASVRSWLSARDR